MDCCDGLHERVVSDILQGLFYVLNYLVTEGDSLGVSAGGGVGCRVRREVAETEKRRQAIAVQMALLAGDRF